MARGVAVILAIAALVAVTSAMPNEIFVADADTTPSSLLDLPLNAQIEIATAFVRYNVNTNRALARMIREECASNAEVGARFVQVNSELAEDTDVEATMDADDEIDSLLSEQFVDGVVPAAARMRFNQLQHGVSTYVEMLVTQQYVLNAFAAEGLDDVSNPDYVEAMFRFRTLQLAGQDLLSEWGPFSAISDAASDVGGAISGAASSAVHAAGDAASAVGHAASGAASGVVNAAKGAVKAVSHVDIHSLSGTVGNIAGKISSVSGDIAPILNTAALITAPIPIVGEVVDTAAGANMAIGTAAGLTATAADFIHDHTHKGETLGQGLNQAGNFVKQKAGQVAAYTKSVINNPSKLGTDVMNLAKKGVGACIDNPQKCIDGAAKLGSKVASMTGHDNIANAINKGDAALDKGFDIYNKGKDALANGKELWANAQKTAKAIGEGNWKQALKSGLASGQEISNIVNDAKGGAKDVKDGKKDLKDAKKSIDKARGKTDDKAAKESKGSKDSKGSSGKKSTAAGVMSILRGGASGIASKVEGIFGGGDGKGKGKGKGGKGKSVKGKGKGKGRRGGRRGKGKGMRKGKGKGKGKGRRGGKGRKGRKGGKGRKGKGKGRKGRRGGKARKGKRAPKRRAPKRRAPKRRAPKRR